MRKQQCRGRGHVYVDASNHTLSRVRVHPASCRQEPNPAAESTLFADVKEGETFLAQLAALYI